MSMDIINELRSAATTLRTPTGCVLPAQDRITAELLDRAAAEISGLRSALPSGAIRITAGFSFGELLSADFEADTITLRMEPGYQVRAGRHGLFHMPHGMQGQVAPTAAPPPPAPATAPPAPKWEDAPAWARFVAMDADGQWTWYENRPYPETEFHGAEFSIWDFEDGRMQDVPRTLRFDGWETTLQERPAPTASITVAGAPLNAQQAADALRKIEDGGEQP